MYISICCVIPVLFIIIIRYSIFKFYINTLKCFTFMPPNDCFHYSILSAIFQVQITKKDSISFNDKSYLIF